MRIKLDEGAFMPLRGHPDDAGLDLRSPIGGVIRKGKSVLIDTGVHIEIPAGFVGMLKSKSGLNTKFGVVNEGVIDAGYTGSIAVKLYNHGEGDVIFEAGDKISQLVILPVHIPEKLEVVDTVEELYDHTTERGSNGFGSTGR